MPIVPPTRVRATFAQPPTAASTDMQN